MARSCSPISKGSSLSCWLTWCAGPRCSRGIASASVPCSGRVRGTSSISVPRSKRCSRPAPFRRRADPQGLDHLFNFFALTPRRTLFAGVQAIAPGHYVKVAFPEHGKAVAPVERKYWDFDFPDWGDEENPADGRGPIDAFEAVFARAVEIRLRADVPVAGYLSGGVDSGLCARHGSACCRPCAAELHRARPWRSR